MREAAAALRACPRGKAAIYLGGRAALAQGEHSAGLGSLRGLRAAGTCIHHEFLTVATSAGTRLRQECQRLMWRCPTACLPGNLQGMRC